MNSLTAFVALLGLSYLGGLLSKSPISRRLGLASGMEFVLLGIVVGPHVLGVFHHDTVVGFEPLLLMVLGWLAAVLGIQYGRYDGQRVEPAILVTGILVASLTGIFVFSSSYAVLSYLRLAQHGEALLLALGLASVLCGSAHQAVRWATGGQSDARSLSRVLGGIGSADDLPPLVFLALLGLFSSYPTQLVLPFWVVPLSGLGLGVVLGATVAALLGRELERSELWPVLLGAVLLVVGIALRLGLPLLTPVFLLGVALSMLTPHRTLIRELVVETERPLLVPALLLAGALVDLPSTLGEWTLVGAALLSRLFVQFILGASLTLVFRDLRGHALSLGQGLLSTGGAALAIALAIYFRHPGRVGRVVLFSAVLATLLGEILGGLALRRIAAREQGSGAPPLSGVHS